MKNLKPTTIRNIIFIIIFGLAISLNLLFASDSPELIKIQNEISKLNTNTEVLQKDLEAKYNKYLESKTAKEKNIWKIRCLEIKGELILKNKSPIDCNIINLEKFKIDNLNDTRFNLGLNSDVGFQLAE